MFEYYKRQNYKFGYGHGFDAGMRIAESAPMPFDWNIHPGWARNLLAFSRLAHEISLWHRAGRPEQHAWRLGQFYNWARYNDEVWREVLTANYAELYPSVYRRPPREERRQGGSMINPFTGERTGGP